MNKTRHYFYLNQRLMGCEWVVTFRYKPIHTLPPSILMNLLRLIDRPSTAILLRMSWHDPPHPEVSLLSLNSRVLLH